MSLFNLGLPTDLVNIIVDFIHTAPPENHQRCMYELLHHIHFAEELTGQYRAMRPSEYILFIYGVSDDDYEWAREFCPLGAFADIHYAHQFLCNPDSIRRLIPLE